jgi:hypothetical protein
VPKAQTRHYAKAAEVLQVLIVNQKWQSQPLNSCGRDIPKKAMWFSIVFTPVNQWAFIEKRRIN